MTGKILLAKSCEKKFHEKKINNKKILMLRFLERCVKTMTGGVGDVL
jgi:hypothetical protein